MNSDISLRMELRIQEVKLLCFVWQLEIFYFEKNHFTPFFHVLHRSSVRKKKKKEKKKSADSRERSVWGTFSLLLPAHQADCISWKKVFAPKLRLHISLPPFRFCPNWRLPKQCDRLAATYRSFYVVWLVTNDSMGGRPAPCLRSRSSHVSADDAVPKNVPRRVSLSSKML